MEIHGEINGDQWRSTERSTESRSQGFEGSRSPVRESRSPERSTEINGEEITRV
jgi:hypothetical protein